jgi:peptide deformylase
VEALVIRSVLLYPDARLRGVSKPLEEEEDFNDDLVDLIADLRETMQHYRGVGLSAPQIGVMKRVVVITGDPRAAEPLVLVNPVITHLSGNRKLMREGCLSFPGVFEMVMRSFKVRVSFLFPDKLDQRYSMKLAGLQAHVVQHELEHLDGILLSDHKKIVV